MKKSIRQSNINKSVVVAAALSLVLAVPAYSADSWWKKGLDIVRSIGSEVVESEEVQDGLAELTNSDTIAAGLKEALKVGSERVVEQLSLDGGFNLDPQIHIELPDQLQKIKPALERVGLASTLDDLENRLNQAAETATPIAKDLFINAIADLTLEDVSAIYQGENDAATQYFKNEMSPELSQKMQPIIRESLAEVGAIQIFDQVVARYNDIPFVPKFEANLNDYVVDKAVDGIFYYLAKEEAAIRENPVERTTDLLKSVFGAQ